MSATAFTYISTSEQETAELAGFLAKLAPKGSNWGLKGPLGAGKSVFSRAFAQTLGLQGTMASPSYPIILEYPEIHLCHMDWYRLGSEEDLMETGVYEYLEDSDYLCLIEWWDKFPASLSPESFIVDIELLPNNSRRLSVYRLDKLHWSGFDDLKASLGK